MVAAVAWRVVLDPVPDLVEARVRELDHMKRVSDLGRVGQRVVEGLAIRARQVQRRRLDAIPPGLRAGGEPVRRRLRAAALDNIEELRWPIEIGRAPV